LRTVASSGGQRNTPPTPITCRSMSVRACNAQPPCARRHGQGCSLGSTREARPRSCPARVAEFPLVARLRARVRAMNHVSVDTDRCHVGARDDEAAVRNETATTVSSNLMADPELRYGAAGAPVAQFAAAFTPGCRTTHQVGGGNGTRYSCAGRCLGVRRRTSRRAFAGATAWSGRSGRTRDLRASKEPCQPPDGPSP